MADAKFPWQVPKNRELLGGDLVAQALKQLGADICFGLHGGHLDSFLIGAVNAGLRLIDSRHETTAVQAAEGYAKLSGKVGVCFVTANSGFCNSLPGISTAFADRSPIFVVTSSPPLRDAETNCLQGFHDQVVLAKPISKFAHRVTNVEEIPRIVAYAYRTAMSGIPGPVVVDFPIDVLFTPPQVHRISYGSVMNTPSLPPAPNPAVLTQLLDLWKAAKRPVIICGTGAARLSDLTSDTSEETLLIQLAQATSTPVFYSNKFSPRMPYHHPLRSGPAANLATLPSIGAQQPDLVVLLGARTGFLLGGRSGAIIPNQGCKLAQVDIDGGEIGKSHAVDLGIISDSSQFVITFLHMLSTMSFPSKQVDADGWVQTCGKLKDLVHARYAKSPPTHPDGRLHPYHALKAVFEAVAPLEPIVLTDGGECGVWALSLMENARALHSLSSTGYLGFLGNGWGYSLGAALAHPSKLIINIQGDGSAGFHIQELDTYARHDLNILTVVVNNDVWGMSIAGQEIIFSSAEPARPVTRLSPKCRYDKVAEGFNCHGAQVSSFDDIKPTVDAMLKHMATPMAGNHIRETSTGGSTSQMDSPMRAGLLNLLVSTEPVTDATKGMVGKPAPEEANRWICVPYYDNIPRPMYPDRQEKDGTTMNGD